MVRDGSIQAVRNRENDATITSTGGEATCQPPTGTFTDGNPQVALRLTTRTVTEPVGWILRRVLRSQGGNPLAEPRRPPQEWAEIRPRIGWGDQGADGGRRGPTQRGSTDARRLQGHDNRLPIQIEDDGGASGSWQAGIGLQSVRERAAEVGGACSAGSTPTLVRTSNDPVRGNLAQGHPMPGSARPKVGDNICEHRRQARALKESQRKGQQDGDDDDHRRSPAMLTRVRDRVLGVSRLVEILPKKAPRHFQSIAHRGACRKTPSAAENRHSEAKKVAGGGL